MTARISLILGKTGAHRAPLQLRLFNFFTASMTAGDPCARHHRRSYRAPLHLNVMSPLQRGTAAKRQGVAHTPEARDTYTPQLEYASQMAGRAILRHNAILIFLSLCIIYVSVPTKNYYWDGIGFAQDIEQAAARPDGLLHPNHLLYNALGHELWTLSAALGYHVRALGILQLLNAILGAATAAVLFSILRRTVRSPYAATCLAFGFAFSATWWKFATDANSYIPSTFLLTICLWLLLGNTRPAPFALGVAHAGSALLHQLAIFFYPAAVLGLWYQSSSEPHRRRLLNITQYTLSAAGLTLLVYSLAFAARGGSFDFSKFVSWCASHSPDASFSFAIGKNAVTSLLGQVKLVLGGRLRLFLDQRNIVAALSIAAMIVTLAALCRRIFRAGVFVPRLKAPFLPIQRICLVWIFSYVVFLLFWLPHNTFYRLFYLPALVLLAGIFIGSSRTGSHRLALSVAVLFFFNFGFHIYPQAQPGVNPALQIATTMREVWGPGTIVYWDVYAAENRTIRYFNPQAEWKELWGPAQISQTQRSLAAAKEGGGTVWFDSVALEQLMTDREFRMWLKANWRMGKTYEFFNRDRKLGFVQLLPAPETVRLNS